MMKLASTTIKRALSNMAWSVMRKHPKFNSVAWKIVLKTYDSPVFSQLVAVGSRFAVATNTDFGSFKFRPAFFNETLMAVGLYEPHLKNVLNLELGQTFLDIGSNIGFYTMLASRSVGPTGKVVSIEPNPETFRILNENVKANCSSNTIAVNCGAGSKEGYLEMYLPSKYPAASTFITDQSRPLKPIAKVAVATVDSLVRTLGISKVDWMKIDVEGMEADVIKGSTNVLRDHQPRIVIETMNSSVVQFLRDNNYCVLPVTGVVGLFYARPLN